MIYYFVSSLPFLKFGDRFPFSVTMYKSMLRSYMGEGYLRIFEAAIALDISFPDFIVRRWCNFEFQIRNFIAMKRGESEQSIAKIENTKGYFVWIKRRVFDAFNETNPLLREILFEKLRWDCTEEISGFNLFSKGFLISYGLKLSILERMASFNLDEGRKRLLKMVKVD